MPRPTLILAAFAASLALPAAFAGGGCGCGAPVVPGATVDLEFAGCPGCATCAPTCGAPAGVLGGAYGPTCAAPVYAAPACDAGCAPVYAPAYAGCDAGCCDNRDYTRRPGCGTGGGLNGGLRKLWDLEKRKNAWLKKTFFDGPRGKLCGLQDDCAPVCAPICAPTCGAPVCETCEPACAAPAYPVLAEPACAAPAYVDPTCAAPVYAAPTCGCN